MVLNREEILNEAAIGYAAFIGSDTDNAVMELRRKARWLLKIYDAPMFSTAYAVKWPVLGLQWGNFLKNMNFLKKVNFSKSFRFMQVTKTNLCVCHTVCNYS